MTSRLIQTMTSRRCSSLPSQDADRSSAKVAHVIELLGSVLCSGSEQSVTMLRGSKVKLSELNPHLICVLCGGYYIDATTILECLHTFCKTCIVRYLQTSKYCPVCDVMVHKTKPLLHIRADQTLQALVYKMVPGLYLRETRKRKEFYSSNLPPDLTTPDEGLAHDGFFAEHNVDLEALADYQLAVAEEEHISLSLHFSPNGCPPDAEEYKCLDKELIKTRFLLCPGGFTVGLIKKFIRMKLELEDSYKVDVFHSEPLLDVQTLVDVAYVYCWTDEGPVQLFYSVYQNVAKRRRYSDSDTAPCLSERRKTDSDDVTELSVNPIRSQLATIPTIVIDESSKESGRSHRSKERKKKRNKSKKSKKSHKSEKRSKSSKRSRSSCKGSKHKSSRKRKDSSKSCDRPPKSAKLSKEMKEIPTHKPQNVKKKLSKTKRKESGTRHLKTRFLFPSSSSESEDDVFMTKPPLVKPPLPDSDSDTEPLSDIPQPGRYVAGSSSKTTAAKPAAQIVSESRKARDVTSTEVHQSLEGNAAITSEGASALVTSARTPGVSDGDSSSDEGVKPVHSLTVSPTRKQLADRPRSKSPKGHLSDSSARSKSPKQRSASHSPRERSSQSPNGKSHSINNNKSPKPKADYTYSSSSSSTSPVNHKERQPILLKLHKEKLQLAIKHTSQSSSTSSSGLAVASSAITTLSKPRPITILSKVKSAEFQQAFMKHVDMSYSSKPKPSTDLSASVVHRDALSSQTSKRDADISSPAVPAGCPPASAISQHQHSTFNVANDPSSETSSNQPVIIPIDITVPVSKDGSVTDRMETSKIAKKKALLSESSSKLTNAASRPSVCKDQSTTRDVKPLVDSTDRTATVSPNKDLTRVTNVSQAASPTGTSKSLTSPRDSPPFANKGIPVDLRRSLLSKSTVTESSSMKTSAPEIKIRAPASLPPNTTSTREDSSEAGTRRETINVKLPSVPGPRGEPPSSPSNLGSSERHPHLKLVLPKYPMLSQRQEKTSNPPMKSPAIPSPRNMVSRPNSIIPAVTKSSIIASRSPVELPKDLIKSLPISSGNPVKKPTDGLAKTTSASGTQTLRISRPIKRVDDILKVRQASAMLANSTSTLQSSSSPSGSSPGKSITSYLSRSTSHDLSDSSRDVGPGFQRQNSLPEARHSMPPLLPTRSSDQSLVSPKKSERPVSPLKIPSPLSSVKTSPTSAAPAVKLSNGDAPAKYTNNQSVNSSENSRSQVKIGAGDSAVAPDPNDEGSTLRSGGVNTACHLPKPSNQPGKELSTDVNHLVADNECSEVNHNTIPAPSAKPQSPAPSSPLSTHTTNASSPPRPEAPPYGHESRSTESPLMKSNVHAGQVTNTKKAKSSSSSASSSSSSSSTQTAQTQTDKRDMDKKGLSLSATKAVEAK